MPPACIGSIPSHPLHPSHPTPDAAKKLYGTALANVDWLHGGAESLLTITNLFIVLGLRDAIRKAEAANAAKAAAEAETGGDGGAVEERQPAAPRE